MVLCAIKPDGYLIPFKNAVFMVNILNPTSMRNTQINLHRGLTSNQVLQSRNTHGENKVEDKSKDGDTYGPCQVW